MKISILCVGKIKEKFYTQAVEEYSKRLSRYCKLDIVELADEKTPDNASDVVNDPESLHKTEKEDGDDVYYKEDTNEFVVVSTDGYIRTYFNPDAGKKYFDRQ